MKWIYLLIILLTLASGCLCAETPAAGWAANTGEVFDIRGYAIAIDSKGFVFASGSIRNDQGYTGSDALLLRLSPDGQAAGSVVNGGFESDVLNGLAVDRQGNCFATGDFSQEITFGEMATAGNGNGGAFIAKMDTLGSWMWAISPVGTYESIWSDAVATDSAGNCYATGCFDGTVVFGPTTLTSKGGMDVYVAKVSPDGQWLWAASAGGMQLDMIDGIRLDAGGNIYVSGQFSETAAFGTTRLTSQGSADGYVAKLDNQGKWLWARQIGGEDDDFGRGVALDAQANCFFLCDVSGEFSLDGITIENPANAGLCLVKLDTNGKQLWYKLEKISSGRALITDKAGNCFVGGIYYGEGTWDTQTITNSGHEDLFVAKLDTNGNLLWLKNAGGSGSDVANDLAIDEAGNCYVTGSFSQTAVFGQTSLTSKGSDDIFIYKIPATE